MRQAVCRLLFFLLFFGTLKAEVLVFPQVVTGPNWTTTLRVTNLSAVETGVTVWFHLADGRPWPGIRLEGPIGEVSSVGADGMVNWFIPPFSSFRSELLRSDQTEIGFAELQTSNPSDLLASGFLTYSPDAMGQATARVGLLPPGKATWSSFPVEKDTAIALFNPGPERIVLSAQLVRSSPSGPEPAESIVGIFIKPRSQVSFFLRELFQDFVPGDVEGHINLWSGLGNSEYFAMSLLFPPDGVFTSIPVKVRRTGPFDEQVPLIRYQTVENGSRMEAHLDKEGRWRGRLLVGNGTKRLEVKLEGAADVSTVLLVSAWGPEFCVPHQLCGFPLDRSTGCITGANGSPAVCVLEEPEAGDWFIEVLYSLSRPLYLEAVWE